MITRYIIALNSDPVSYYDGGTDGDPSRTCQIEKAKIYSRQADLIRDFNRLSKQYPNRKIFVKYL